jgi:hypothetical protein
VPNPARYQPHLQAELRYVWQLCKSGFVRDIYLRHDRLGAAIFAEADSVESARAALVEFPLGRAGLIGWEVIPL